MATPQILEPPQLGQPGEPCADCGAVLAADQRYCVNCGRPRADSRVPFPDALEPPGDGSKGGAPADPARAQIPPGQWSPMVGVIGVGVVALVLAVGVLIGRSVTKEPKRTAGTPQVISVGGAGGAQAATASTSGAAFKSDWPAGKDGWTVQLQALSKDSTQPPAVTAAKTAAQGKGAAKVGALDSDDYPSLDGGQYVVYSGVYGSQKEAQKALAAVKKKFPQAKVIHVSKKGASGGGGGPGKAQTLSPKQLQDLNSSSGTDYFKKSSKLPKKIATQGPPPPKDNKAPGGGSGGGQEIQ